MTNRKNIVIISHTNFINSIGGTEKYINDQIEFINNNNNDVLSIYPTGPSNFKDINSSTYGTIVNTNFTGIIDNLGFINCLENILPTTELVYFNHIMFWSHKDLERIISLSQKYSVRIILYVHDFYICCPNAFALHFEDYCLLKNTAISTLNPCTKCHLSNDVHLFRQSVKYLLSFINKIIVPSDYIKMKFCSIYPEHQHKVEVRHHLKLENKTAKYKKFSNDKLRIAYLGSEAPHKGWSTWQRLSLNPHLRKIYDFYHIGKAFNKSNYTINIPYSFKDNGLMTATNLLINNNIDMVILWSYIPESYSYTLYESIAAAVPVLSNVNSGNIAHLNYICGFEIGKNFSNEADLTSFLFDLGEINSFLRIQRYSYSLKLNQVKDW